MKKSRYFVFSLIFVSSMISGFSMGAEKELALPAFPTIPTFSIEAAEPALIAGLAESIPQVDLSSAPSSNPTLDVAQVRNILVIGVNQVTDPVVQLEAVWMLFFHRDTPVVQLIPVFPSFPGDDQNQENTLSESFNNVPKGETDAALWEDLQKSDILVRDYELAVNFKLNSEGEPDEAFWNALKRRDILWHNYVLIDERVLNAITELMDLTRPRDNDYLHHWDDDAQASINGQLAFFAQVCESFAQRELVDDISPFISNLAPFLSTDIPPEQIVDDWRLLKIYGENLRCDFPTLTVSQD